MTVRELLDRVDSRELSEWIAYENETGPLGQERLDYLFAKLTATVAGTAADPKKAKTLKESDFMIKWKDGGRAPDGNDS